MNNTSTPQEISHKTPQDLSSSAHTQQEPLKTQQCVLSKRQHTEEEESKQSKDHSEGAAEELLEFDGGLDHGEWLRVRVFDKKNKDNDSLSIGVFVNYWTGRQVVLKLVNGAPFNQNKTEELKHEASNNQKILEKLSGAPSRHLVLMEKHVVVKSHEQNPYTRSGHKPWQSYSFLTLPFCKNGTLLDFILKASRSQERWLSSQNLRRSLCGAMFQAVFSLHKLGFAHRDIKVDNAVITGELDVALIDFAAATASDKELNTMQGTLNYCAPEVAKARGACTYFAAPADIFTLGVVIYCLLQGKLPTPKGSNMNMAQWTSQNLATEENRAYYQKKWSKKVGEDAAVLLLWCLNPDPKSRPTIEQIRASSRFINSFFEQGDAWKEELKIYLNE